MMSTNMKMQLPNNKSSIDIQLGNRKIGPRHSPLVIAEIGINHGGDFGRAVQMIEDAEKQGCECVKFQCHVLEDEMIKNNVIPGNADRSIWDIISNCILTFEEERRLKTYVEQKGMIFLSTPFSRAAADRLESLDVVGFKIGSGECNNYPLIKHIAAFRKPIILSTGMNDIQSIQPAVDVIREHNIEYALLHCTSIYPTPYEQVHLGALDDLANSFPDAVVGLSDHSLGNYACFAAVALGYGSILEKHFCSTHDWSGPDVSLSILPTELLDLIQGSRAVFSSLGGNKAILADESPTISFAYSSVVATKDIRAGDYLTYKNTWVKRPGTGQIRAKDFDKVLSSQAKVDIAVNSQISWDMLYE